MVICDHENYTTIPTIPPRSIISAPPSSEAMVAGRRPIILRHGGDAFSLPAIAVEFLLT